MAATLTQLQTRLDALKAARASGLRVVDYAGRRTEFKSDAEMASAQTMLEQDIADASGTRTVRAYDVIGAKGL
jgi:hypothetical protein